MLRGDDWISGTVCVQKQVFKHVKILSKRLKKVKEQKKNKGSVLVMKTACNSQNAQFGLVMLIN